MCVKANPAGQGGAADFSRNSWPVPNSRNPPRNQPNSYLVHFRPLPGVEPIRALRRALKFALRACGLRCLSVEEMAL